MFMSKKAIKISIVIIYRHTYSENLIYTDRHSTRNKLYYMFIKRICRIL